MDFIVHETVPKLYFNFSCLSHLAILSHCNCHCVTIVLRAPCSVLSAQCSLCVCVVVVHKEYFVRLLRAVYARFYHTNDGDCFGCARLKAQGLGCITNIHTCTAHACIASHRIFNVIARLFMLLHAP